MPVNVLLCEGAPHSPDVRLLTRIPGGRGEVRPSGPKYGMSARVLAYRRAKHAGKESEDGVQGLLDGDFILEWHSHTLDAPWKWVEDFWDGLRCMGWRWSRKEIENYLIDPSVVRQALGSKAPSEENRIEVLYEARDRIAAYQAARTALAAMRAKPRWLENPFGRERGKQKHRFPEKLDRNSCVEGLRACLAAHNAAQALRLEEAEEKFEHFLQECLPGGNRHRDFPHAFAGKDLLCAMENRLHGMGFASPAVFLEKILAGIESATENVRDWLPEWQMPAELMG
jgi:hypothetical protein